MSNADQTMRTGFIAILLGVGLLAIIPASLAQSDIADVLTTQASSEIGNPLRAQINVGSLPSLRGDISVSLASQGAFEAFEIGRYQILSSLRFSLRMNSAENYLLDIDSASPLNEPSLRFVVAFTGGGETSLMPIEVLIPVLDDVGIQRPTLLSRPNETLWRIANRTRDDEITNAQQMLAVQQLNPESFRANNINGLKPWSMLALPDFVEAQSVPRHQAEIEVAEQNASWRSGVLGDAPAPAPVGRVRITEVDDPDLRFKVVPEVFETASVDVILENTLNDSLETPELPAEPAIEQPDSSTDPAVQVSVPSPGASDSPTNSGSVEDPLLLSGEGSQGSPEDPFDLDQIEQQIREEENTAFTRTLETFLSFRSMWLIGGVALIALLVPILLRRRAAEQEQALEGVLGSGADQADEAESGRGEPAVSVNDLSPDQADGQDEQAFPTIGGPPDEVETKEEAEETLDDVFTTRLKLAEAYLEMGDRDGAVDMLQEVIADGSEDQQDIARRIMDRIENGDD